MLKYQRKRLETLMVLSMLVAMHVVLSRFFSLDAWNMKIGFSFIPVFLAARRNGPAGAAFVGGLADWIGATLFPKGTYFFGFTLTAVIGGLLYGLFLQRSVSWRSIAAAVMLYQLTCSLCLNTLWISLLYGKAFWVLLPGRILQAVVMAAVQIVLGGLLLRRRSVDRMLHTSVYL